MRIRKVTLSTKDMVLSSGNGYVYLVSAKVTDAQALFDLISANPLPSNFSMFTNAITLEDETAYLKQVVENKSDLLFLIRLPKDDGEVGKIIGTIGLHEIDLHNRTARMGIIIFSEEERGLHHGRNAIETILKFAFEESGFNKVYINVWRDNLKNLRYYPQFGFVQEGLLREEYIQPDGTKHDLSRMAILASEWQAMHKK